MKKLQYLWEELNASFWFLPILMLLITIGSAIGLIYLDSQLQHSPEGILKYLLPASVDSARSILSIIAGAMIGVAGTVFSITLVVLTLASSQLSSRLVRNFMYDKLNQVVLGSYVSSFVYCLIILSSIKEKNTFSGMLNAAFNQIRQFSEGSPSVMIRLREAMTTVNKFARNKNQKELIAQHAEMIMNAAEKTFKETRDLEDMSKRFKDLKQNS